MKLDDSMKNKYPGNSNYSKGKEEEPREMNIKEMPKTESQVERIKDDFVYKIFEPILKNAAMDIVDSSLDTLGDLVRAGLGYKLFGDTKLFGRRRRSLDRRDDRRIDRASYNEYYDRKTTRSSRETRYVKEPDYYEFDWETNTLMVKKRRDAEEIIDNLNYNIKRYGYVSLSTLYSLIQKPWNYTYQDYGWSSLDRVDVRPHDGEYMILFPKPMPIEL